MLYRCDDNVDTAACRRRTRVERDTSCFSAIAARSAVYTINNSGPSTEPCGTEQTM